MILRFFTHFTAFFTLIIVLEAFPLEIKAASKSDSLNFISSTGITLTVINEKIAIEQFERVQKYFEDSIDIIPDSLYLQLAELSPIELDFIHKKNDYVDAFAGYIKFIGVHPESPFQEFIHFRIAQCLFLQGKFLWNTRDRLEEFVRTYSESIFLTEAYLMLAELYEKEGEALKAIASYWYVIYNPQDIETKNIFYKLGSLYFVLGRYYTALTAFQDFTNLVDSTHVYYEEALFQIENIFFYTGKYPDVVSVLKNFVRKYPNAKRSPQLQMGVGDYYRGTSQYIRAINAYQILLDHEKWSEYHDLALLYQANCYELMGQDGIAAVTYRQLIESTADMEMEAQALLKMGQIHRRIGNYSLAIANFQEILNLEIPPEITVNALFEIANTYGGMEAFEEELQIYRRIIEDFPDDSRVSQIKGKIARTSYQSGHVNKAIGIALSILDVLPESDPELILLGTKWCEEIGDDTNTVLFYDVAIRNGLLKGKDRTHGLLLLLKDATKRGNLELAVSFLDSLEANSFSSEIEFELKKHRSHIDSILEIKLEETKNKQRNSQ